MSFRVCNFPKPDGTLCGSPALRGEKLCYYHQRDRKRSQYAAGAIRRADVLGPRLPPMKSLVDVQAALREDFNALAAHRVPLPRAGRILFDLEQAAVALRQPNTSPR